MQFMAEKKAFGKQPGAMVAGPTAAPEMTWTHTTHVDHWVAHGCSCSLLVCSIIVNLNGKRHWVM